MRALLFFILMSAGVLAHAQQDGRFVSSIKHPSGQTLVVAEGDFEACSIGSFSVRLYQAADERDATTFFTTGLVRPRDGIIRKVLLADVNADNRQELIVVLRSVGTGGYLSAQAFNVADNVLSFYAEVSGLAADADPVAAFQP